MITNIGLDCCHDKRHQIKDIKNDNLYKGCCSKGSAQIDVLDPGIDGPFGSDTWSAMRSSAVSRAASTRSKVHLLRPLSPSWVNTVRASFTLPRPMAHSFADGGACLACLYLPMGAVENEHERVSEELKIPDAYMEIRNLLQRIVRRYDPSIGRLLRRADGQSDRRRRRGRRRRAHGVPIGARRHQSWLIRGQRIAAAAAFAAITTFSRHTGANTLPGGEPRPSFTRQIWLAPSSGTFSIVLMRRVL